MAKPKQITVNLPDAPAASSPCSPPEGAPRPSLSQFSSAYTANTISDSAEKMDKAAKRLRLMVDECGRVEETFEIYKTSCNILIGKLRDLSSNLLEEIKAAREPIYAGLSDDTIKTINAIPGNVAKEVVDEIVRSIRAKIYHEVNEGFKDLERRRKVCAIPWPVFVPLMIIFLALIVFTVLVVREANLTESDFVLSIFSSCMGWMSAILVFITIVYGIWLSCR